ncbi:uncharacterized protein [Littorina saxatilis]|uniref:EF-hand domain-containing protein n=2 Tax=Littorina saxatilis TaxID=31220 RepID=A0AAN9G6E1_9CAEN
MMSKTFLVLLVICAMLVPDSEGWRRRRRRRFWRRVGRFLGDVGKGVAVGAVVGLVGKRDIDCGQDLTPEESNAVVQQLEQSCPGLGLDPSLGLDRAYVEATFATSDANDDGALTGDELDDFVMVIEALHECEDYELQKKK